MADDNNYGLSDKLSNEFKRRLNGLKPGQKVRAIVLLRTQDIARTRQAARNNRRTMIDAVRQSAETALPDIDEVLRRFDGKRLSDNVSALGSISVEMTAAGIKALATLDQVKAILEDQPVSSLPKLKHA
jgi:hypothetical protein